jgi:hypothetical protein
MNEAAAFSLCINCLLGGSTIYYTLLQPLIVIYIEQTLYYPLLQYAPLPPGGASRASPTQLSSSPSLRKEP